MKNSCVEVSIYGERNYKLFLEVIRREIDKEGYNAISAVQAFMLMNMGDNVVTIGEIISRGYYIGTNATYNIKKLINAGYLASIPSSYDKRAIYLRLTSKGQELIQKLDKNLTQYMKDFESKSKGKFNLTKGIEFLKDIETFWNEVLLLRS